MRKYKKKKESAFFLWYGVYLLGGQKNKGKLVLMVINMRGVRDGKLYELDTIDLGWLRNIS